ncbi:uncharacterized protein LOC142615994 [Castanea sativa]|uniref:uncharacterized protein LOC142615994 n=1 Tax=Castanea sativa TaxID=21020 RepID=UPI003F64A806
MATHHARSNSFPSEPHPLIPQIDEHLCRLKNSEATSSSSICHKLSDLQDLHDCVDKLLLLPLTQQAFIQDHHRKWFDQLLDGSLRLLDVCSIAKDALLEMKTGIHELQSTMRRRQGGETRLAMEVGKYFTTRKEVIKAVQKALKGMESNSIDKNHETQAIISTLRTSIQDLEEGIENHLRCLLKTRVSLLTSSIANPEDHDSVSWLYA